MKLITIVNSYDNEAERPQYYLKADTALLRNNDAFYIPDGVGRIVAAPHIVLKVSRIAKCIGERFAARCIDGVMGGIPFTAIDRLIEIAPKPKTIYIEQHDTNGSIINAPITFNEWIKPRAEGSTPMHEALAFAYTLIERWCHNLDNRYSFPPMVFHITDGDYNDAHEAELLDIAQRIMQTHTEDGNTLLFNIHLSSDIDDNCHEIFPHAKKFTTDRRDRALLFKMSSIIPKSLEPMVAYLLGLKHRGPYRGVTFNSSPCDLLAILNIGTESANNIRFM